MKKTNENGIVALVNVELEKNAYDGKPHTYLTVEFKTLEDGKIRNVSAMSYDDNSEFADLRIYALYRDGAEYGFHLEYHDVYTMELNKARKMCQFLERVNKSITKLSDKYGAPSTFAQFVNYALDAMDVKDVIKVTKHGAGWSWDDSEYTSVDRKYLGDSIRWMIESVNEKK